MNYKIAQLEIKSTKKIQSFSEIYLSQPNSKIELLVGKLFLLININSNKKTCKRISNYIIENLYNNFYNNEKIILKERISSIKTEHIFETALTKTNKSFYDFLKKEKQQKLFTKVNITAGIIYNNHIHFANTGNNKIILIHKSNKENNENKYLSINLSNKKLKYEDSKLFSDVLSGKIPKDGTFLFSSENLPEYISNKQLIETLSFLPPASAVEQLKLLLSEINSFVSFNALIIKRSNQKIEKPEINEIQNNSIKDSVSALNSTEQKTEKLLSPSGIISSKKWTKSNKLTPTKALIKDKIVQKHNLFNIQKYLLKFIKIIFIKISSKFHGIKNVAQKKNDSMDDYTKKSFFSNSKLKLKTKILFSVLTICIVLFIYSINSTKNENLETVKNNEYSETTTLIKQKIDQADSSMLYGNENKAQKLTGEATNLISTISTETESEKNEIIDFQNKIEVILNKLRKVININSATKISNFKNLNSNANIESIIFLNAKNKLYASDSSQNSIYTLDINNEISTSISELKKEFTNLSKTSIFKNDNIYYLDNNKMIELDTNNETTNIIPINLTSSPEKYSAIDSYNNRLYVVNTDIGQIQRYNYNKNGFISPYPWLNKKIDLSEVVDISIDGNIYLLKNNGEILKFLKGEMKDFSLNTIDPKLEKPTRIYASPELDYIYILESKNNRIIIFDKSGKLINQYKNKDFNIVDFAINEKDKIMYILSDNSIYSNKLEHIE
ncbi:hypothetical protein KAI92_01670 [Candidatus Parcubacteria bacterium]|nr:hypothetical protein [Candidatus Parcubacteria bacterium]